MCFSHSLAWSRLIGMPYPANPPTSVSLMPATYAGMSRSSSGRSHTRSPCSSGRSGIGGVASFVTVRLLCCDELPEHAI